MLTYATNRGGHGAVLRSFRLWEAEREMDQARLLERLAGVTDHKLERDILCLRAYGHCQRGRDSLRAAAGGE